MYNKILTISQKKFQWRNALSHFIGIHKHTDISLCPDNDYCENESENDEDQNQNSATQIKGSIENQNENSNTEVEGSNEDQILDPKNIPI